MAIDMTPVTTRKPPLPGHIMYSRERVNCQHRIRAGSVQSATATITPGFDGARDLGITYDGLIALGPDAADVTAWLALMNTALAGKATVTHNAGTVTVTSVAGDFNAHTLVPYNPSAPDLQLSAFTITPAVSAPQTRAGMAVVWKDRALRTVQAPLPDSELDDYVGIVDRVTTLPGDLVLRFNSLATSATTDTIVHGQHILAHRYCTGYARVPVGLVVAASDPVYFGRLATESGYYFNAQDGGNTRMLVPGAQFMTGGTGDAEGAGFQIYFK